MIRACELQVRAAMGAAYGVDFAAVMAMGAALGAPARLLAETLPRVEPLMVAALAGEDDE